MIARVRGVIARSVAARSSVYVAGSISTKTGVAPVIMIVVAEATERERGRDDFVPGPDAERAQRQPKRVRAGGDTERPGHAAQRRQLLLERLALGAEHELAGVDHTGGRGEQLGAERGVLTSQVDERNHLNPGFESAPPAPTRVLRTFRARAG